jgi:AAHS family 4-hydroxybenzoate transporter-like MFS transporter
MLEQREGTRMTQEATAAKPLMINVGQLIDEHPIGFFQVSVLLLCATAMFVDGFDTQAIGYVAPALSAALAIKPGALSLVFAAGGLGAILGTLGFAPFADRIGRKPIIVGCVLFFALCSIATAAANTVPELMWMRFATGLGLGGVVPNALALTADFMPKKFRVTLVLLAWLGFSIGSAVAGPITAHLLEGYTWRTVFIFGGVLPILIAPVLLFALPESLQGLAQRGKHPGKIRATLSRIDPTLVAGENAIYTTENKNPGFPVAELFREGRSRITIPLWIMFFMILLELFFLNSWLPTIFHRAGIPQHQAIVLASLLHFGGIVGGLAIAPLCDKFRPYLVLATAYLLSGFFIAAIGISGRAAIFAIVATFCAGFFTFGGQNTANAIAALNYPPSMRSSGIGWALGIGRTGQIVGPLIGGLLLTLQWGTQGILYVIAVPSLVAAAAALLLRNTMKGRAADLRTE